MTNGVLTEHIEKLSHNFYSETASSLSLLCLDLFKRTHNRNVVGKFLDIAYTLEIEWRVRNPKELLFCTMVNPVSFDTVSFDDIFSLDKRYTGTFTKYLRDLEYKKYLLTPYWRAVRGQIRRIYHNHCAHCDITERLETHHLSYKWVGEDHLHLDNLVLMCRYHHQSWHDIDNAHKQAKEKGWISEATKKSLPNHTHR